VLVILGILTAVVMSRGSDTNTARVQADIDILKGNLRYAQYLAMNDVNPVKWGIEILGSSYKIARNSSGDGTTLDYPVYIPNESSETYTFSSGVTATVTSGNSKILFDEWGSPPAATTISIGGQTITITATTGFIP
jgi:hypothetical protein